MIAKGKSKLHQTIDQQCATLGYFISCKEHFSDKAKEWASTITSKKDEEANACSWSSEMSFISGISDGIEINNMLYMFIYAYFETSMHDISKYVKKNHRKCPSAFSREILSLRRRKWKEIDASLLSPILGVNMSKYLYIKDTIRDERNKIAHENVSKNGISDETLLKSLTICHKVLTCFINAIDTALINNHKGI